MKNLQNLFFLCVCTLIFAGCPFFDFEPEPLSPSEISDTCFSFSENADGWTANADLSWYRNAAGNAQSHNWDDRENIDSPSGGGALVFNGDSLTARGVGAGVFTVTSPVILRPEGEIPGVTHYQYFKNYRGAARLEVKPVGAPNWTAYPLNQNYGDFMESLPSNETFTDISEVITPAVDSFNLRFVYEGGGGFWIIDDVCVTDITDRRVTKPFILAQTLHENNYPFLTDSLGGAYVPQETVVQFAPQADPQTARDAFQITEYETCDCNDTELWKSPIVLTPIEEKIGGAHFPTDSISPFVLKNSNPYAGTCAPPTFSISSQTQGFCNLSPSENFTEHTGNITDSGMLLVNGESGTTLALGGGINLASDSLYVFSFFARLFPGQSPVDLEVRVGTAALDTVQITTAADWGRYDVLLNSNTGGSITLRQLSAAGIYALDDLYLGRYRLANNTIIDINGVIETANTDIEVNEGDLNFYNFDLFENAAQTPSVPTALPNNPTARNGKLIAILDTGIDYNYNSNGIDIQEKIYRSEKNICYNNDEAGYNFVAPGQPPFDDSYSGHGTHVAGIIVQNMPENIECDYRLLPVKTHDTLSLSTLFRVSCAVSFATEAGADYINASWGYYGEKSQILYNTMSAAQARGVEIICSAGNDTLDIVADKHWPSGFTLESVITVAATNDTTDVQQVGIAPFSNTSAARVDYGTAGINISSTVPAHVSATGTAEKDGTSMAAPRLLALLAAVDCSCESKTLKPNFSSLITLPSVTDTAALSGIKDYKYVNAAQVLQQVSKVCQ